ncbi:hypothetical protein Acsp04_60430 [Actinomadura sp. NBRC 104425]|nr:hypothetical protein Acsp04_60430 [Actinomadura sp. NBRC 104425]
MLAAAANAEGSIITQVADVEEATIVFSVLERGSDGVMLVARAIGDATALRAAVATEPGRLDLAQLEVRRTEHVGMGERACVDTCTYFQQRGFLYEAIAHVMAKGQPEVEVHARRLLGETGDSGTATSRTKGHGPGRPLSRITGDYDSGHTVGP